MSWVWVFLGGGAGAVARYGIASLLPTPDFTGGHFPWPTWSANFLACLLLGAGLGWLTRGQLSTQYQLLLITGFCGGFSTFSTFAAELLSLYEAGYPLTAGLYLFVSVLSGVVAILVVARWLQ